MRSVGIINYLTDKKPIERPYWITVYDPSLLSFRVTLYDNFTKSSSKKNVHKITVEILHDGTFHGTQTEQNIIFEELLGSSSAALKIDFVVVYENDV